MEMFKGEVMKKELKQCPLTRQQKIWVNFRQILFEQDIVLGRGKVLIYGISPNIYRLKKNNILTYVFQRRWVSHFQQIYENLNQEIFKPKVLIIESNDCVFESISTRIILIARVKVHQMQYDLQVVYEFGQINQKSKSLREQKNGFEFDKAKIYLRFL
ncbi:unnamed protein product [Paramecium sonneborni]|uniref:Uncharacterized protein n=1 Tax=Paramecium sonneborni TaxID=65129 RepID=A0A8S1Q163_9CILI|nr:unnamed protein product [Paramecium sonneborni]